VNAVIRFAVVGLLILNGVSPAKAKKKSTPKTNRVNKAQIEAATRLQVFLDRANFSPGKIDGRYNDFTWKALVLYRESLGEPTTAFAWRIGTWCDLPQKSKRAITSQFTELR
jgi:hypothetical protein